jgi:hypothetical protein
MLLYLGSLRYFYRRRNEFGSGHGAGAKFDVSGSLSSEPSLEQAASIVGDYGEILGDRTPGKSSVLPESLLPHPKEKIKGAIRLLLSSLPPDVEERHSTLETGYVILSSFVADEEARLYAEGRRRMEAIAQGENIPEDACDLRKDWERAQEILEKSAREADNLRRELQAMKTRGR